MRPQSYVRMLTTCRFAYIGSTGRTTMGCSSFTKGFLLFIVVALLFSAASTAPALSGGENGSIWSSYDRNESRWRPLPSIVNVSDDTDTVNKDTKRAIGENRDTDGCNRNEDCEGYDVNSFCRRVRCHRSRGRCVELPSQCPSACIESERRCVQCTSDAQCERMWPSGETPVCQLPGRDVPRNRTSDGASATVDAHGITLGGVFYEDYTCRPCAVDAECSDLSWCSGGARYCSRDRDSAGRRGLCRLKSPPPCPGQERTCVNEYEQCAPCTRDKDCGEFNFCTNPVMCDTSNGRCQMIDNHCPSGKHCDASSQRCVECTGDDDCRRLHRDDSYCGAVHRCDVRAGECVVDSQLENPCQRRLGPGEREVVKHCDEERKTCHQQTCITDEECDDGICENGQEVCRDYKCIRRRSLDGVEADCNGDGPSSQSTQQPQGGGGGGGERGDDREYMHDGVSEGGKQGDPSDAPVSGDVPATGRPLHGRSCEADAECHRDGLLCRVVTSRRPILRECRPCRTDPDCMDGYRRSVEKGQVARCNRTLGGVCHIVDRKHRPLHHNGGGDASGAMTEPKGERGDDDGDDTRAPWLRGIMYHGRTWFGSGIEEEEEGEEEGKTSPTGGDDRQRNDGNGVTGATGSEDGDDGGADAMVLVPNDQSYGATIAGIENGMVSAGIVIAILLGSMLVLVALFYLLYCTFGYRFIPPYNADTPNGWRPYHKGPKYQ